MPTPRREMASLLQQSRDATVGASTSTSQATTTTCGVKSTSKHAAPAVGQSATYQVHLAGSVTVLHETLTTLKVTSVKPAAGWLDVVVTASGTKVHVGFQLLGAPLEQERFWARINSTGTVITTVLQTCT
jgi:hypothetical protein